MKTFYNVVNAIICCAKEARASIVLDIEWVQYLSCKIVKTCRILGLNRAKKKKILSKVCMIKKKKETAPHSIVYLRRDEKNMFKRLVYTPPDLSPRFTCKVNLSNTKNPAWFFIFASLLDRRMERVNWLPPRTIVCFIFRGCPIIHGLSKY